MKLLKTILRGVAVGAACGCCFVASVCAQEWERIGPEGGNVISLAAAGETELFLGTADGHVFASRDAGEHWDLRGRVWKRNDSVVQRILVDVSGKRLYAAVWTQDPAAGGGVYSSQDGGRSWQSAGLQGEAVRALVQSASNPNVLVAGTRTGVFASKDAGKGWERISPAGDEELRNLDSVAIDPRDPEVIYAGTYHLPWKTGDGGKNWTAIAEGMIDDSDIMSMEIDRKNPAHIFASACSGIYRSENGGAQWTKLQGIPYASRRTQQIAQGVRDENVWFAGTTEGLWRSGDGGENWARVTGRDVVTNAIAFSAKGKKLIVGTEEGILESPDEGSSFAERNTGFSHRVLTAFARDANVANHLLVAVDEPEGLFESNDGGKSWVHKAAPGSAVRALFSVGGTWIAALRDGGAVRFEKGKWKEFTFAMAAEKRKRGAAVGKPPARPVIYGAAIYGGRFFLASSQGIWTSGASSSGVLRWTGTTEVRGTVAEITANRGGTELFAIAENKLMRSTDAGKNWVAAATPVEAGEALWMRAEDSERPGLLVGCTKGVWEYAYGANWGATGGWRLVQNGLPAVASWDGWIGDSLWMISMKAGGVFVTKDRGKNWDRTGDANGEVVEWAGSGEAVFGRTRADGLLKRKE